MALPLAADAGAADALVSKARLVFRYNSPQGGEKSKTFLVSESQKGSLESLVRMAFSIPPSDDVCLVIDDDIVCFPLATLDMADALRASSLLIQAFPAASQRTVNEPSNANINPDQRDDKRRFNRGLDQRRSYLKEEKIIVMLMKDTGRSAEEIAAMTSVSKSNIEKWCSDKTRESILPKYRNLSHDRALLSALEPNSAHFQVHEKGVADAAMRHLLDKLRLLSQSSSLLALEATFPSKKRDTGGRSPGSSDSEAPAKRGRPLPSNVEAGGDPRRRDERSLHAADILSSLTTLTDPALRRDSRIVAPFASADGESDDDIEIALIRSIVQSRNQARAQIGAAALKSAHIDAAQFDPVGAKAAVLGGSGVSKTSEDFKMQYAAPSLGMTVGPSGALGTSVVQSAQRPMLQNTRIIRDLREHMHQRPAAGNDDDDDEEEDRRMLRLLGE